MIHNLRALVARLRGLFGYRSADQQLGDEIEMHLRLLTERYISQGMSEARGRTGCKASIRKRDSAKGGKSRDAWHQIYRDAFSRFAIWPVDAAEKPWLHLCRGTHAGAGDRGEYGYFQRRERGVAQTPALLRSAATGLNRG
jgi:hypothetical protein